jgi:branched-chain amino acid transport system substrate-binding protein
MMNKISRRQFLAAAGAAAAAGVLSACGASSSAAGSTAASGAASGASASGDTIKVGVLGPKTAGSAGDVSVYGLAVINGADLYLNQYTAKGDKDINGKKIEIIEMDEQGDDTQAVNCFTQMCDKGITGLVGDVTTTPTLAVVAVTQDESDPGYNMPMVTASATAEAVTYDSDTDTVYTNVFRSTFTDPYQGLKMADYAYEKLGFKNAAIIMNKDGDYQTGLAASFTDEFTAKGGTVVDTESYSKGDSDFKAQLTTIMSKNPEVVFCPNYYQDVGQILAQARDMGLTVPFLGGDGWDGVAEYASAEELDGCYFCANYAAGASTEFESAYKTAYGEDYPNGFAPLGYDAAMTLVTGLQGAEDAGLEAGTADYKQKVIDTIKAATIKGVTGSFTFDEHNDPVKTAAIQSFKDGKPVYVENY